MSNSLSTMDSYELVRSAVQVAIKQVDANKAAIKLAEEKNIPLVEAKRIMLSATKMSEEELTEMTIGQLDVIITESTDNLSKKINHLSPDKLMGVIKDATAVKMNLKGLPKNITEHRHTIGSGVTADELRARLAKSAEPTDTIEV